MTILPPLPFRIFSGFCGMILIVVSVIFLPSFLKEFLFENGDVLGAIAFPTLAISVGVSGLVLSSGKDKFLKPVASTVALGALLVVLFYIRAFSVNLAI